MWPDVGRSSPPTSGGDTDCRRRLPDSGDYSGRGDGEMGAVAAGAHRDSVLQVGWGEGSRNGKFIGGARARDRQQWRAAIF